MRECSGSRSECYVHDAKIAHFKLFQLSLTHQINQRGSARLISAQHTQLSDILDSLYFLFRRSETAATDTVDLVAGNDQNEASKTATP